MTGRLFVFALLASVSALPLAALAQSLPEALDARPEAGTTATAPLGSPVDFAADQITYDRDSDIMVAEGNVILARKDMIFHADRVTYNRRSGKVTVAGDIWAKDQNGTIVTAKSLDMTDDFKTGIVENMGVILNDDSRFAAESGRLLDDGKIILNRAVYSPCEVCAGDPHSVPLWQVKAVRVIHDGNTKRVTYHNAFIEFLGVPVLYTPYFSHPDPSVHAGSGFLAPTLGRSSELGLTASVPYYFALAPNRDATFEPIFTQKESIVLAGEYRENVGRGKYDLSGSITYVDGRDDTGALTGHKEFRGHVFSKGRFRMSSLDRLGGAWQWRYDAGWASDDTYLRRYNFSKIDTLQSEAAIERFDKRSYAAVTALHFQGLRVEDVAGLTPVAMPLAEYHFTSAPDRFGGTFRLDANALALTRFEGMDTQRISIGGGWELPLIGDSGSVYTIGASLRGDLYHVSDSDRSDDPIYAGTNGFSSRILPQVRFEWRLPLIKEGRTTRQTLEPIVALIGAFNGGNPESIPNEDSRLIGFDDTNLFAANRFTGLDRWESGSRIDYGVRYSVEGEKLSARFLIGQSYRFFADPELSPRSGLSGHWSDIVGRLEVTLLPYLDVIYRVRLDDKSLALRRNEVDAVFGPKAFRVNVGYVNLDIGTEEFSAATPLIPREEVRGGFVYQLNDYWSLVGSGIYSLDRKQGVEARGGAVYEDECLRFGFYVDKTYTRDRDIGPETTFMLKISLKNLG